MKIALIGYGKMGKAIEKIAIARGHQIVLKISSQNLAQLTPDNLAQADVAIEFTNPDSAYGNVSFCIKHNTPVVCGSTGWQGKMQEIVDACKKSDGAFLHASNFSVGVNIFFEVNKRLAALMQHQSEYDVVVEEIHHTAKKDAPSGTAVTIAEQILELNPIKSKWVNTESKTPEELGIVSKRIDPAPGTHTVTYKSPIDDIEIKHTAHNREGFAIGAVLAAEFIHHKKGIFTMKDVLSF